MSITDRYATAVRATSLAGNAETMADGTNPARTANQVDVLGAFGLAAKKRPLAVALTRLFAGDNHAAREIVRLLAVMVNSKAWHTQGVNVPAVEAEDIGRKVLAWHRDGACKPCGGLGFQIIHGTPSLSGNACPACKGSRKVPFNADFTLERLPLALWLRGEIEREQGIAGQAAMRALAPRLDL